MPPSGQRSSPAALWQTAQRFTAFFTAAMETSLVTLFFFFQHVFYLADFLRNYLDTVIPTPGLLRRRRS